MSTDDQDRARTPSPAPYRRPMNVHAELADLRRVHPRLATAVSEVISRLNGENARWRTELRKAERRIVELESRAGTQ